MEGGTLLVPCCCCCYVALVMSDSVWPHRWQPTRPHCPWDSPGKNTGVGCHFLLQCMKVKSESEVAQSCPTLSDPMDCSLPGSFIHGIFQARVLEWVAIAFLYPSAWHLASITFFWINKVYCLYIFVLLPFQAGCKHLCIGKTLIFLNPRLLPDNLLTF